MTPDTVGNTKGRWSCVVASSDWLLRDHKVHCSSCQWWLVSQLKGSGNVSCRVAPASQRYSRPIRVVTVIGIL